LFLKDVHAWSPGDWGLVIGVGQPGEHVPTSLTDVYLRLHGAPRIYYSRYPAEEIARWRSRIDHDLAGGRTVWCVFDNTAGGEAVPNALELMGQDGDAAGIRGRVESAGTNVKASPA